MNEVHVIGAGITGLLTAYDLAKRGYSVTVFEKNRYPAQECSYANGGQISVSNSEVWTTWNNVKKGAMWIFKKDAPLYIRFTPEWKKIKWLIKFLYNTLIGSYTRNTIKTIKLGLLSRYLYENIITEENIKFDRRRSGILHFYKDKKYYADAVKVQSLYESNGCEWKLIDDMNKIDSALCDIQNVIGAAWTADDWTGDINKFCVQLSSVLNLKYGVRFVYNSKIDIIVGSTPVVICAGIGSVNLAKSIGDNLPIYPVKGYSITINDCIPGTLPLVSLLDDQAKIVTSTLGNRFRVAGTAELAGENYDITRARIEPLLDWVKDNFPNIDCSNYSQWACLRPMTPDMLPIVRQSKKIPNIFYNTGHGHLGWTLAPATAKQIGDIIDVFVSS